MAIRCRQGHAQVVVVDADVFPQTIAVLETRARPLGIEVVVRDLEHEGLPTATSRD